MDQQQIRRGDIYLADFNPVVGSEENDCRPVLVVQNDTISDNANSPTVIVAQITSNIRMKPMPTRVLLPKSCGLCSDSLVLAEKLRTVYRYRLVEYMGHVTDQVQSAIDKALAVSIGLEKRRPATSKMLVLSLCPCCEVDFRNSGCLVIKKGWQDVKTDCDFCKAAKGLIFGIFNLDRRD